MISVRGVTKKFQDKCVLNNIEMEVKSGEILGLAGPNGAGKTTLLNIIAGILLPSHGKVEICGYDAPSQMAHRNLGYIPDTPFIYPKLTGREFLHFVGSLYRIDSESLKKKISQLAKALEISPWLDELMEGFPRGVRQKMTLAAMLLHSPRVLLLDEPTANLDPKSARLVKELLQKISAQGASILLSTHILEIAERLCARLVILDEGKIVASGSRDELREISHSPSSNLEDIFLRLTGGEEYAELLKYIS